MSKTAIAFFAALFFMIATDAYAGTCDYPKDAFITKSSVDFTIEKRLPKSDPEFALILDNMKRNFGDPGWEPDELIVWKPKQVNKTLYISASRENCSLGFAVVPASAIKFIFGEQI
jgi:hypothetical protein